MSNAEVNQHTLEPLLQAIGLYISHVCRANDERTKHSAILNMAKPVFRRFKLWECSYDHVDFSLDALLSSTPILAEEVMSLLCSFVAVMVAEFGYLASSDAIGEIKSALRGVPFLSDLDILSASETSSSQGDESDTDSCTSTDLHADVDNLSDALCISELSDIVDALYQLSPVLDDQRQAILDRIEILERANIPVDERAILVNIASKFPYASDHVIGQVTRHLLRTRNRLQGREQNVEREHQLSPLTQNVAPITPSIVTPLITTLSVGISENVTVPSFRDSGYASTRKSATSLCPLPSRVARSVGVASSEYAFSIGSSFGLSMVEDDTSTAFPKRPALDTRGMVRCSLCKKDDIMVSSDKDWRRHVFQDVKPYICLDAACTSLQAGHATRKLWRTHYISNHKSKHPSGCPFRCGILDPLDIQGGSAVLQPGEWYRHVAKHFEDLLRFVLRPSLWQEIPDGDGKASGSNITNESLPLSIEEINKGRNAPDPKTSKVPVEKDAFIKEWFETRNEPTALASDLPTTSVSDDTQSVFSSPPVSEPTESTIQVCFRVSDIPLTWNDRHTLNVLTEECSSGRATGLRLSLYPSMTGRSQVGILTLAGPREYVDAFAPLSYDNPKRLVMSGGHHITIDRQFYGLTPLNRPADEVYVDIIAVAGFAGHAYESWRHRNSGRMWLEDFLPNDLKGQARIMTFGYDISLTAPSTSFGGMLDFGRDLLQRLKVVRQSASNRPLIFVGHSLGCIVIAKVLLMCRLQEQYKDILEATRSLIFFGAPQEGLRTNELEEMVDDLQVFGTNRLDEVLRQLREHSNYLQEHEELLIDIWKDRKIISFDEPSILPVVQKHPETRKWDRDGKLVTKVQRASSPLFIPSEERIPVPENRYEIAKFESSSDSKYNILVGYIWGVLENIENNNRKNAFTDDQIKWLKSLRPSYYEDYRNGLLYKRHPNTCVWLLHDEKFRLWNEHDDQTVLWIKGGLGCGKSILAAFLSNEIPRSKTKKLSMAYFFCDDKDERLKTASAMLVDWLAQLLTQIPSSIVHFPEWTENETSWTFEMLWRVLQRIVGDAKAGDICLLVDALDECEEESRTMLLERLNGLMRDNSVKQRLKLVITSRPHIPVTEYLGQAVGISLGASNLAGDIESFVQINVGKRLQYSEPLLQEIQRTLIEGANGMFLWVSLVLDDLETFPKLSSKQVMDKLKTLPNSLSEMYIKILHQIPADFRSKAQIILRWVIWARRPLTLAELTVATVVKPYHASMSDIQDGIASNMAAVIRTLFGSMLRIDYSDNTIHLVHQSARDFLQNMRSDSYGDPSLSAFYIPSAESHLHISMTCLTYLSLDECREGPVAGYDWRDEQYRHNIETQRRKLELLDYAATHWPDHIHQAYSKTRGQQLSTVFQRLEDVFLRFAESSAKFDLAYQMLCFSLSENFMHTLPLQVVASFGLLEFTQKLLDRGADVDDQSGEYVSALIAAAYNGHKGVVELLIDHGANINAQGEEHGNALQAAAARGHEEVVRLLIESGADVNAQGSRYGNVLQAAVLHGHEAVVRLLIDYGANINAQSYRFGSALHAAVYEGDEEMAQLLLDHGADVNAQGGEYGTALHVAASKGRVKMIRRLLDRGADVNAQGGKYGNALQAAAYEGSEEVVRLLLNHGADVNSQGGEYGNAPQAALRSGNTAVVRLLVNRATDINTQGGRYANVLQAANDHPDTLTTVDNVASEFRKLGEHEKALEWYQRALDGYEKMLGKDHLSTLTTVHNIAMVFNSEGEYEKALAWYQRALDGREKTLGEDHPDILSTANQSASIRRIRG